MNAFPGCASASEQTATMRRHLPLIVKKYDIVPGPRIRRTNLPGRSTRESAQEHSRLWKRHPMWRIMLLPREVAWPWDGCCRCGHANTHDDMEGGAWQTELESIARDNGSLGKSIRNDIRS